MANELAAKKVEVAGLIICELIRKDVLPLGLTKRGGMSIDKVALTLGTLYQSIWQFIDSTPGTRQSRE